jgi:S-adenosylmethionine synthetase
VRYENWKPVAIDKVVVAVPHHPDVSNDEVKDVLYKKVITPLIAKYKLPFTLSGSSYIVNGTGIWTLGGPVSDSGVTGRKIIVDTYGGMGRHGGGAFSGKDPSKVDRSGAYAARHVAKNLVAAGLLGTQTLFPSWWKPSAPAKSMKNTSVLLLGRYLICVRVALCVT